MNAPGVLAIVPARGGSKGLPGKNTRPFCGLPLIAHAILFARSCPEVSKIIVTTDSPEIAEVARSYGADVPFLRPRELAADDTPLWPVLQHALRAVERHHGARYRHVALIDPTTPCRLPDYMTQCVQRLLAASDADGIVAVSQPDFNPIWTCVVVQDGWMRALFQDGGKYERRQDVPTVFRINGALYVWTSEFVRTTQGHWREEGRLLAYEIPDAAAIAIDTLDEFNRAELFVKSGFVRLPWLDGVA
jgi:N-acylneuraminate cytidylyltransferase